MEEKDPWLAADKVYHIVFCFSLTLLFSTLASLTSYPFLRRHAIPLGSIASLLAGAAKEAADHLGYFHSAGASAKDAVADVLGSGRHIFRAFSLSSHIALVMKLHQEKKLLHIFPAFSMALLLKGNYQHLQNFARGGDCHD